MNTICAGIVTYNPDIERLIENLNAITPQVDKVYIIDNGSTNIECVMALNSRYNNLETIALEKNYGIAKALNTIFSQALGKYDWVLTLDQDTVVNDNLISKYTSYFSHSEVVSLCPVVVERVNIDKKLEISNDIEEVSECITSGNIVKTEIWQKVGGFYEDLFIDQVDFEFCYRLRKHGFKIYRVNTASILHEIGSPIIKYIFGKRISIYNHTAFRKYYIYRNGFYIIRNYPQESKNLHLGRYLFIRFIYIVLFENDKLNKINSVFKGIRDSKKIEYTR